MKTNMKKIISAVALITMLASSFATINTVSAADWDHKLKPELWTKVPLSYYEEFTIALNKEDLKSALIAYDYAINQEKWFGATDEELKEFYYYKEQLKKGILEYGMVKILPWRHWNVLYREVLEFLLSWKTNRFQYQPYWKYFTKEQDKEREAIKIIEDNWNNNVLLENNNISTNNWYEVVDIEDEVENTPIVKVKETNKYKLKLKWYDLVKFDKIEKQIEKIITEKLLPSYSKMSKEEVRKKVDTLNAAVERLQKKYYDNFTKGVIEEVRIQVAYFVNL